MENVEQTVVKAGVSLHRVLSELKNLSAAIYRDINNLKPCGIRNNMDKLVEGTYFTSFEDQARSSYQSILDRVKRFHKLQAAKLRANAGVPEGVELRTMTIAGEQLTAAEMLERKKSITMFELLLNKLVSVQAATQKNLERSNYQVLQELNGILASAKNADPATTSTKDFEDSYKVTRMFVMVDPLNIQKEIDRHRAYIDKFTVEQDAALSEFNASTMIVVE